MFMGEYNHTIDTKGRMIIPAKIREQLGDLCIVTKGLDDCLAIYTQEAWKKISDALQSQSSTKASVRALKRFVLVVLLSLSMINKVVSSFLYHYVNMRALINRPLLSVLGITLKFGAAKKYDYYDDQVAESMEELVEGLEGIML